MTRVVCRAKTPIGVLTALYEDGVIRRVFFPDEALPKGSLTIDDSLDFNIQMSEYFSGKRRAFTLPILIPGTQFVQDVYRATLMIPYGEVASYSDVAFAAGYPRAMRAVGTAMKNIPLPVLIPCHRVVHKAAKKSAYRGGIGSKNVLLNLELQYK
ncbi:MAG: methylated-DNA--[protein]-cysteine S-methyltransferase [Clostridia bacterium]|jgi:methylated-DNA-[protein]-cysteine S-methyltransferase|nr:methylated-DNA--[protein]-cysteine S-methyltransferase [Clostridia bacterium]MBT7122764.1 methylated-DNA--[protein]-cysteine S-methyltransferase [Clostridia bacterium]